MDIRRLNQSVMDAHGDAIARYPYICFQKSSYILPQRNMENWHIHRTYTKMQFLDSDFQCAQYGIGELNSHMRDQTGFLTVLHISQVIYNDFADRVPRSFDTLRQFSVPISSSAEIITYCSYVY